MNSKLRVLHAIRQGQIGGGESHVLSVVKHLDRDRFEPVVLSFTPGPMVEALHQLDVPTHVIPTTLPFDVRTWRAVGRLLRREAIDVVHAHGSRALSNVFQAANRQKVPLAYTVHGWSFHPGLSPLTHRFRVLSERWLTGRTDLNICVSQANRAEGVRVVGESFRAEVVLNGIDLTRFDPTRALTDLRATYGFRPDQNVIGFVARMTHQKDPLALVEAFGRVARQHPEAELLLIGSGELLDAVQTRVAELNLGARVVFGGFRQDVPEVLRAIDIFCLPSLWEGMPIGIMEALAMEKAVIATAVDGTVELIQDGVNGLLVPPQQPERLADALHRVLADEPFRQRLANQARRTVLAHHDVGAMTRQLEGIYERLAAGKAGTFQRVFNPEPVGGAF